MDVWHEAGKQALYGIVTVFAVLSLLIGFMRLSSAIVARIERIRARGSVGDKDKSTHSGE